MKKRCYNQRHESYQYYGERGISLCDEWANNFEVFEEWALTHGYDDTLSIDRIDNADGYNPDNCRWVTPAEQATNRSTNHKIEYNGEIHCLQEWADILGINCKTLSRRICAGWPIDIAFTTPVMKQYARR